MRIEVPFTAGEHEVVVTYQAPSRDGHWYCTWTYRAAEVIKGIDLTRAINAEGDALFGSGGLVHVRLVGEAPPP